MIRFTIFIINNIFIKFVIKKVVMDSKKNEKLHSYIFHWPVELRNAIKAHAAMRNETINNWITRAIIEQLEREKTYISLD